MIGLLDDVSYYVLLVVGGGLAVYYVLWFLWYAFFGELDEDFRRW